MMAWCKKDTRHEPRTSDFALKPGRKPGSPGAFTPSNYSTYGATPGATPVNAPESPWAAPTQATLK